MHKGWLRVNCSDPANISNQFDIKYPAGYRPAEPWLKDFFNEFSCFLPNLILTACPGNRKWKQLYGIAVEKPLFDLALKTRAENIVITGKLFGPLPKYNIFIQAFLISSAI